MKLSAEVSRNFFFASSAAEELFQSQENHHKKRQREERIFLGMRTSVLRGVRRLPFFIFGHLCVHTSSEHDPSDHVGHPAARWLLHLGDTSRSTQTLRLITLAQCWGLHRLSSS